MMTSHACLKRDATQTKEQPARTGKCHRTIDEGGNAMTATAIVNGPMSEADHQAALRRAVIASTVGTTIEWYDFLIYSTVTGLVLPCLLPRLRSLDRHVAGVRRVFRRLRGPAGR